MKLATIDIGSNSIHLLIVEVDRDGHFRPIDREREMVRLGAHDLTVGRLASDAVDRARLPPRTRGRAPQSARLRTNLWRRGGFRRGESCGVRVAGGCFAVTRNHRPGFALDPSLS